MSKFLSKKYLSLEEYTPGEQPRERKFVKLNTNESPYLPSVAVEKAAMQSSKTLNLYSDPESRELTQMVADLYDVKYENVLMTNGSDEILNFAFMAFCDGDNPIVFPNITYGFYPVFAEVNNIPYKEIPLKADFSVNVEDYISCKKNIVIANPNAPTGIALCVDEIEKIVVSNPDNVVVIDEAYVDFGAKSCVNLIKKYDNLLVTQTFSKSRSLAGARLGFGIGNEKLIADLNKIKYSTNPYNVNRMTSNCGIAVLESNDYYMNNCKRIMETREKTRVNLEKLNFEVLPSSANFLFARSRDIGGEELYLRLKEKGVLVRHFTKELIKDYNRITIGTPEQMGILIDKIKLILKGE